MVHILTLSPTHNPRVGRKLDVGASTVIVNRLPVGKVGKQQQLHTDTKPAREGNPAPVLILTLKRLKLLISPFSHSGVQTMINLDKKLNRSWEAAFVGMPKYQVRLEQLEAGDLLIMHGYCAHAGWTPLRNRLTPRAHWYLVREGANLPVDNTYSLEGDPDHVL